MTGNGGVEPVRLVVIEGEGKAPTLEQAQELVKGWVEMVRLPNGDQMLVNEEGLLHGLPFNPAASMLAQRQIVGDVVVLKGGARWD